MRCRARYLGQPVLIAAAAAAALLPALLPGVSAAAGMRVAAGARAAVPSGTWGKAEQVPGLAADGPSGILSVSCASRGNCSAGGYLSDSSSGRQAFVVSEKNGTWGRAEEVPGTAALNTGQMAEVDSVSCASPGNCSAAGEYATPAPRSYPLHAFVVSEKNGVWGKAEKVPGIAALSRGSQAQINSVSCASAGNCSAGGSLSGGSGQQAFVVSQDKGRWGKAEKVPGLTGLHTIGFVNSVSCAPAGNCSAGGYYVRPPGTDARAFVVSRKNGRWGEALQIPRMGGVSSLSCASAGNCSAGGMFVVVSEKKGTWGKAEEVPGLAALGPPGIMSVSCGAAGNCSAGGWHSSGDSGDQGFVVSQSNGVWGKAEEVPGLAALSPGGPAFVVSVSCGAAGNCSAGGSYANRSHRQQGFVVSQDNGVWGKAEEVPGLAALNKDGFAQINSVSCASAGNCSAGGSYLGQSRVSHAFVVSEAK